MVPRTAFAGVLVVVLLASAGCSGVFGEGAGPVRETYDVPSPTPTPTPTATPSPTRTPVETVVPGIATDRIMSPIATMSAHSVVLENTSFRVVRNLRVEYANGTTARQETVEAWVSRDRRRYLAIRNTGDRLAVYADGTSAYSATWSDGGIRYDILASRGPKIPTPGGVLGTDLTYKGRLYRYLGGMNNVSVDALGGSSQPSRYQVSSSDVDPGAVGVLQSGRTANETIMLVVTDRGVVEVAWVVYTRIDDGQRYRVFESIRYHGVGETSVPSPEWITEARRAVDGDTGQRTSSESGD